jgi:hypothetical protein
MNKIDKQNIIIYYLRGYVNDELWDVAYVSII